MSILDAVRVITLLLQSEFLIGQAFSDHFEGMILSYTHVLFGANILNAILAIPFWDNEPVPIRFSFDLIIVLDKI